MRKAIIIILAMLLAPIITTAQQGTKVIYGRTYTLNDLPVSGISVKAKKASSSAVSDSIGNFMIVCNEKDRLKFDGGKVFRASSVKINGKTPDSLRVKMNFAPTEKNVELAIGYGFIDEKHRTQAIEYAKNKIDYCSYSDIYDVLRNNFPTLQIRDNGCVIIRGPSSLYGSNCALYVVDNVKTDNIDHIPPCNVKDISVLKDGSAAIYGVESANGVIIINLKKGEN